MVKNVLWNWNNTKYIPLQYNEEHAHIQLHLEQPIHEESKGNNEAPAQTRTLESSLELGDRGLLTTEKGQLMKIVLCPTPLV